MIISHKYKYLFVELPHTGTTAIRRELCENYDGVSILSKHSNYYQFLRTASDEEKHFFAFSCIRNPLDVAVTKYFKYKSDHRNTYTDARKRAKHKGVGHYIDKKIFDFVQKTEADFATFFMTFYRIPYNSWANLHHKEFDFIIRFENLADDFAQALDMIGIEAKRPLPTVNKTDGRKRDFALYYSPEAVKRAKRIFGPYMKEWGYEFPPEWGDVSLSRWNEMEFRLTSLLMKVYWRHLRKWMWHKDERYTLQITERTS
jgi:hypothetical protein